MTETGSTRAPRRRLKSLLSPPQKRLLAFVVGGGVFMVANTLYLIINRLADLAGWTWISGGTDALPAIFQWMVLSHTGAGLVLSVLGIAFVVWHLRMVWVRRHATSVVSGVTIVVAGTAVVFTGLLILTASASQSNGWAWWTHVIVAALVPAGYAAHRLVSLRRPADGLATRYSMVAVALTAVLVIGHAASAGVTLTPEAAAAVAAGLPSGASGVHRDVRALIGEPFVPQGLVPPQSAFFPSPATTGTGDRIPGHILVPEIATMDSMAVAADVAAHGFATETLIGARTCVPCHADITEQWATSAHRFSSFNNPFYEATISALREKGSSENRWMRLHLETFGLPSEGVGVVQSRWCGACHDPALLFTGVMNGEIDRRGIQAQAGLTCTACHRIDSLHDRTGNGNYNVRDLREDPYLFNRAPAGSVRAILHDASLKAKPLVHKREFLKPFFSDAVFCASCHKVSIAEPLNEYRWIRGQNEFDNWHDSGIALNASRTFYLPPVKRICQDCHMPMVPAPLGDLAAQDGRVRSHRFNAANTALPYLRGDTATLRRIEEFLRTEKLSVDIFAIRRESTGLITMGVAGPQPPLQAGERVRVDIVVRNRGVGHTFPGGTNDSNEAWLELTLRGADGGVLAQSGFLADDGHLDPDAHVFKAVLLDGDGQAIHDRNGARIHVAAAVNVIGPGASDLAQYAFEVPDAWAGRSLSVEARLLWRKFDRKYTEFAFARNREGFRAFEAPPDLPVTEIAADRVEFSASVEGPEGPALTEADWERFNDYGIALLLQGNTREARGAFERVSRDATGAFDGHLNLARVALRDGNLERAFDHLDEVERVRPADARAAWVWANALQEDGDYERAVQAYGLVLDRFPGDRAAWRNLGRTLYLDQHYDDAVAAFARVLEIDPEDRVAHYNTMLSLRALGRTDEAALSEQAYERYRIDESAQSVTRAFRERNPAANLMSQPIHTHELVIGR